MIETEKAEGITVLRLAHGKASALDVELLSSLSRELENFEESAKAIVICGTGNIFSAGVDLFKLLEGGEDYLRAFLPVLDSAFERLFTFPRPVVAAINGHAIAGGCILAQCGDYRIMAEGSGRIGVPELLVGVPFPTLAMEIVRFSVPRHHIQKVVYRGSTLTPVDALSHGLIDEVCDPERLLERALEVARSLADIPAETFRITKRQLRAPSIDLWRTRRKQDEAIGKVWASKETAEHIRRYLERTVRK